MSAIGIGAVAVVLLTATVVGLVWRTRTGRVRVVNMAEASDSDKANTRARLLASVGAEPTADVRLTLLQLSSTFCAPCRATKTRLAAIAADYPAVRHLDVDVGERLDAARIFDIRSTPTTVVLDADGVEIGRAVGVPRPDEVRAAIASALAERAPHPV